MLQVLCFDPRVKRSRPIHLVCHRLEKAVGLEAGVVVCGEEDGPIDHGKTPVQRSWFFEPVVGDCLVKA